MTQKEAQNVLGRFLQALLAHVLLLGNQHTQSELLELCGDALWTGHRSKPPACYIHP